MLVRLLASLIVALAIEALPACADEPTDVRAFAPQFGLFQELRFESAFWPGANVLVDPPARDGRRRVRISGCAADGSELVSDWFSSPGRVLIAYELGDLASDRPQSCEISLIVFFTGAVPNFDLPGNKLKRVEVQAVGERKRIAIVEG